MIEDTALDPQKAATAAAALIKRGAQFIIGPQTSSEVRAVKPITDAAGVVLVSQGSTAGTLSLPNDTVFRFVPEDSQESKAVAEVAAQDGIKVICPVWRGDDGNRGLVNALRLFGPGAGVQILDGFEYPVTGATFSATAASLAAVVATQKATKSLSEIAIFMAAFDEGADLLNAAAATNSDLSSIKWYAGDGVTLSSAYLQPGPAAFAIATRLEAPTLALPAQAQLLRDPILVKTTAAGVPSPLGFAFAAYDAFVCCTLAWLLAGGDRTKVRILLPGVARTYFGTTGWTLLNVNGDRAIGDFEFFGIDSNLGVFEWKSLFTHQVGG
jgi:branched-chain amino acid transport system substrate-binding protein